MTDLDQQWLLNLARWAIESELINQPLKISKIPPSAQVSLACFVTLTAQNRLRGCIGHLQPVQALYQDVIDNARAAAFADPRFAPVTQAELPDLKIEISVLNEPQKYNYQNQTQLLDYLTQQRPGVILAKNGHQATFLPQVWQEITAAPDFLTQLSLKAGLPATAWQQGAEIQVYQVEKMTE